MKCIFTPKYAVACPFYDKESKNCNFKEADCYFEEYIYNDSPEDEENEEN